MRVARIYWCLLRVCDPLNLTNDYADFTCLVRQLFEEILVRSRCAERRTAFRLNVLPLVSELGLENSRPILPHCSQTAPGRLNLKRHILQVPSHLANRCEERVLMHLHF